MATRDQEETESRAYSEDGGESRSKSSALGKVRAPQPLSYPHVVLILKSVPGKPSELSMTAC